MGLIKSTNAPSTVASFSMRDIEDQARTLLLRAKQKADQLLAAAQAEGEAMKAAAHAQGLAEGKREGLAKGLEEGKKAGQQQALNESKAQLAELVKALRSAASDLDAARHELETQALQDVVALSISVARRVTKRQAAIDPAVLTANLTDAMKLVVRSNDVRIAVHPDQRRVLSDALPKLQLQWPSLEHVEIADDPTLAPGGCRIATRGGEIHADIDGQLDRIVANLLPATAADLAGLLTDSPSTSSLSGAKDLAANGESLPLAARSFAPLKDDDKRQSASGEE